MLKAKREVGRLHEGVLTLYAETDARKERGIDWSTTAGLRELYELPFRSVQFRAKDADILGDDASRISRKVACRVSPDVDTEKLAHIDGRLYEVTRTDADAHWHYLFLSELACDGMATLVATTTTYSRGEPTSTETTTPIYARIGSAGETDSDKGGFDSIWPTLALTIRACDYDRETVVRFAGKEYRIRKVVGDGEWLKLTCEGGVPYGQR